MDALAEPQDIAQPGKDVQRPQPCHRAANIPAGHKGRHPRRIQLVCQEVKKKVVFPKRRPWQDQKENSYLEADQYVDNNSNLSRHRIIISAT